MLHFPNKTIKPAPADEPEPEPELPALEMAQPKMQDRGDQRMTNVIGALFAISSFTCLTAIAVLGLFFVKIVAEGGEIGMIPIFSALGISLVLGMLMLDFTHARALAGYRASRERNARRSKALASAVLCLLLGMIHPLMALAIPLSAGLGTLAHLLLNRLSVNEPLWDFLPKEAISILSGRDEVGLSMSVTRPRSHVMAAPVTRAGAALSAVVALAAGSYLVAENIMAMAAFIPMIFGSVWASEAVISYVEGRFSKRDTVTVSARTVEQLQSDPKEEEFLGLNVQGLSVRNANGKLILTDLNLQMGPGQITGILGDSGSGKSLLLKTIADPFSISQAEVSGRVQLGRTDLWMRQSADQTVPLVLLPPEPIMLPASGSENLACFHEGEMLNRGKWFLERLVFAVDLVESICKAPDAQTLPRMQIKALALARAFLLAPPLYLMDHPEDGLPDKQVSALVHRLQQESRMGRSVLLITNNRALLECCDRLIVLQHGRLIDYGPAEDVTSRMDSGWSRFLGDRNFETEEILNNWIRSHFYRDGDEANRRKVTGVASDLLALSCQNTNAQTSGQAQFLFKHFENYCVLRMSDEEPALGTNAINRADQEASSETPDHKLSPLGRIMRAAKDIDCDTQKDNRRITVRIETYDPRKNGVASNGG